MKFYELKIGDLFYYYAAGVHWTCIKIDPYNHHGLVYNAMTQHRLGFVDQWKFTVDDNAEVTLLKEEQ